MIETVSLRLGIFGGTFDPIHFGHLRSAEEIGEDLNLDKVYLIPAASPPHKTKGPAASFPDRLTMARLAVGESQRLEVLDLEGRRPGRSYSIETLEQLHQMFSPQPQLFFILGIDAFMEIDTWEQHERLFDYAHFVVMRRPGYEVQNLETHLSNLGLDVKKIPTGMDFVTPSGKGLFIRNPTSMDISSTQIRTLVSKGKSIRFLVPGPVSAYIGRSGLYKKHGNPG